MMRRPVTTTRQRVARAGSEIEVLLDGDGVGGDSPGLVVLLPSLGRGAEDFEPILPGLVGAGFRVARPQPRGIGGSTGPMQGITLHDLAADIAAVIEALSGGGGAPAVIAGHAFGNFVARTLATDRPNLVAGVVLLAASVGKPPPGEVLFEPAIREAILGSGDPSLPTEIRLRHLRTAFFAAGNDPTVWLGGWHPDTKRSQSAASAATPADDYFLCGTAPVLDVQAEQDTVAPRKFAGYLRTQLGPDRVTTVVIPGAGHALLPERPALVVEAMVPWIRERLGG
jgi:pimeloyl-ACP methyl ester carboxylesterase